VLHAGQRSAGSHIGLGTWNPPARQRQPRVGAAGCAAQLHAASPGACPYQWPAVQGSPPRRAAQTLGASPARGGARSCRSCTRRASPTTGRTSWRAARSTATTRRPRSSTTCRRGCAALPYPTLPHPMKRSTATITEGPRSSSTCRRGRPPAQARPQADGQIAGAVPVWARRPPLRWPSSALSKPGALQSRSRAGASPGASRAAAGAPASRLSGPGGRAAARRRAEGGAEPARPPQVVRTTIEPAHRPRDNSYDAYEYTAHSHTYNSYEIPSAKARALPTLAARLASAALAISSPRCINWL
jgi:hypothetical protein